MENIYINPLSDWGFKLIFGNEKHKEVLIGFLNDLIFDKEVISDIEHLNTVRGHEIEEMKGIIYDVYCKTNTGERIVVEMQNKPQYFSMERALFYHSKAVVDQGKKGDGKYDIKAVYSIFILNFKMEGLDRLRVEAVISDKETGRQLHDKFRQIFISLPYVKKVLDECGNAYDRWFYILKNMEDMKCIPYDMTAKEAFAKLDEIARVGNLCESDYYAYESARKYYRDRENQMEYACDMARNEGIEVGIVKGRVEGRIEERTKNVRKMLEFNVPIEMIQGVTGFSKEEIEAIARDMTITLR
jgi:predicted transposase/invertase (TIGR01784 family)